MTKGSLGLWIAISQVYPDSRWQRCWIHKTANVLNKLPTSIQPRAKAKLHGIWHPDTKDDAERHFDSFIQLYEAKHPKAAQCLKKDLDALLTYYDFPAEQWRRIRTTNPIESTLATARLLTAKIRGCFSATTVIRPVDFGEAGSGSETSEEQQAFTAMELVTSLDQC